MGKGKTSRKPGRTARANQRLNPIERALVRANWRKAEAELLALQDGADMTTITFTVPGQPVAKARPRADDFSAKCDCATHSLSE